MSPLEQASSRLSLAVERLAKVADKIATNGVSCTASDDTALQEKITLLSQENIDLVKRLEQTETNNAETREQLERNINRIENILAK